MPLAYHPPSTLHSEIRAMHDWIHLERPSQRLRFTLDLLSLDILKEGLRYLRTLIANGIARDISLYSIWRSRILPLDERQQGFAYAGWSWHPPPQECIEKLDREAVMTFLIVDVTVYDSIMDSVRRWERETRPRDDIWHFDHVEEVWRNEEGEEMDSVWDDY
ncbi:uncharacterized protein BDZ99DRAFT_535018 [Mytilinidion resinicola]|uniref:Uncharacterized protein n=1 Tax=Mytilinidion resinicola TaxID=574789 RepID=A0A6A6YGD4_9PEZI|nr:uncharacterized protein BDZ99DRAFT_535018 [Mytilinidion resinicola]KAF2807593.1 hypothetical protein BDZ99DRAFT_535018 [Mytilinidion resinicola]